MSTHAGLMPGQRYYYALGSEDEGIKSAEWSFLQPLEADATATLRFAVAADMGAVRSPGSAARMRRRGAYA